MVVIAMCLGLRVSEILALKWADFDFEDGTLMITRGTVHGRIGRVKTEYSEDEMPLDRAFAEILLRWQAQCPRSEGEWVFPNLTPAASGTLPCCRETSLFQWAGRLESTVWAGIHSGTATVPCWMYAELRCVCAAEANAACTGGDNHAVRECLYDGKAEGSW